MIISHCVVVRTFLVVSADGVSATGSSDGVSATGAACLRNDALCLDESLFLCLAGNSRSLGDSFARSDTFWIFLSCGGRF